MACKTPGKKIRSVGRGRGLARGAGKGPMASAILANEKYGGRPVVLVNGYRYYVVSKHKTNFNARRQFRRLGYRGKIHKVGNWWMIIRGLPMQFQYILHLLYILSSVPVYLLMYVR